MKKIFASLLLALVFTLPSFAQAEEIDVLQLKCHELLESQETAEMMLMWIDGYLSGLSENTTMDDAWIEKLGNHFGEFCGANPNKTIEAAIDAMPE